MLISQQIAQKHKCGHEQIPFHIRKQFVNTLQSTSNSKKSMIFRMCCLLVPHSAISFKLEHSIQAPDHPHDLYISF